jgi:hypothetical protein
VTSSGMTSGIEHGGAKCWDQIAEGYSILNTEEECEGGLERAGDW